MLVLSRKTGERIAIGDSIVMTVLTIQGNKVRLGVEAPKEIKIVRQELQEPVPETKANELDGSEEFRDA